MRELAGCEATGDSLFHLIQRQTPSKLKTQLSIAFWNVFGIPIECWEDKATDEQKTRGFPG